MIFKIIRKEILQNLLSLRFIFSLLLIVSLFACSGFVFVAGHRAQSDNYWKKTNDNLSGFRDQADQLYKLAFHNHEIWRKPKSLTFCVGGQEKSLPNCFGTDVFGAVWRVKGRHNFLLREFGDLDWVFIISLPLSFLALFLTYDSICGEREAGTLRLILSRPIPRSKILLGKYAGAMITIGMPLFVGLFVNLIIVSSSGVIEEREIQTGISDWQYTEVTEGLSEGEQIIVPEGTTTTTTTEQGPPRGAIMIPGMGGPPPR